MWKQLLLLTLFINFMSCAELKDAGSLIDAVFNDELTDAEASGGLREALVQGITKGVDIVSVTDGFLKNEAIKILFPPDVQKVAETLEKIPGGDLLVDNLITKLNRAAEDAAKSAGPIFKSAITSLTFKDVMDILITDNKLAATEYLERTTRTQLYSSFYGVIENSLKQVQALDAWDDVIGTYNKIPFVEKVDTDLENYVSNRALDGLFLMVGKEEQKIRKDPAARVTDLMKRVFAKQDS